MDQALSGYVSNFTEIDATKGDNPLTLPTMLPSRNAQIAIKYHSTGALIATLQANSNGDVAATDINCQLDGAPDLRLEYSAPYTDSETIIETNVGDEDDVSIARILEHTSIST